MTTSKTKSGHARPKAGAARTPRGQASPAARRFDPTRPPRGRVQLGEGVVLHVDDDGPRGHVLRFNSEWANGDLAEALRIRVPRGMPSLADSPSDPGEPHGAVTLRDGLRARTMKAGAAFLWVLAAVWANGDEQELYRVWFGEEPGGWIEYARGAVVNMRPRRG